MEDVAPVMLLGKWKSGDVFVEDTGKPLLNRDAAVKRSLALASLPEKGMEITNPPGQLCFNGKDCVPVGWYRSSFSKEAGGERFSALVRGKESDPLYIGCVSKTASILLIQRPNGRFSTNFAVLEDNGGRNGFQDWIPESPESRMEIGGVYPSK